MTNMNTVGTYSNDMYQVLVKYSVVVIATLPILCIYPFLQRYFIKGVMVGAIKGDLPLRGPAENGGRTLPLPVKEIGCRAVCVLSLSFSQERGSVFPFDTRQGLMLQF